MRRSSRSKRRRNFKIESDNERSRSRRNWLNLRMVQLLKQLSIKGKMKVQREVNEVKRRNEMMTMKIIDERVRNIVTTMMMIDLERSKKRELEERKHRKMMRVERSERMMMMKNRERRNFINLFK